jgi:hypothetical protein
LRIKSTKRKNLSQLLQDTFIDFSINFESVAFLFDLHNQNEIPLSKILKQLIIFIYDFRIILEDIVLTFSNSFQLKNIQDISLISLVELFTLKFNNFHQISIQ